MSRSSGQHRPSVPETNSQLPYDPRNDNIEQGREYLQAVFTAVCTYFLHNLFQLINITALRLEVELVLLGWLWW